MIDYLGRPTTLPPALNLWFNLIYSQSHNNRPKLTAQSAILRAEINQQLLLREVGIDVVCRPRWLYLDGWQTRGLARCANPLSDALTTLWFVRL